MISGHFVRQLIRFNQWMRFIFFILFVLSNTVKCNFCKSYTAYIADCKSTTYYSFKFIIFAFKTKSCSSVFWFTVNYKVKKHYMSSAAFIKSVCLIWMLWFIRSSHRRCSVRKGVVRNSQNLQENAYARVSFLIKLQTSAYIKKRDSGIGVFLLILWN